MVSFGRTIFSTNKGSMILSKFLFKPLLLVTAFTEKCLQKVVWSYQSHGVTSNKYKSSSLICFIHQEDWFYVIIMSRTSFRANLHSVVRLEVKELLARSRRHIWSLKDSNGIRTHNGLVRKRKLDHLTKLSKWPSCVVSTYLYGAFDCMLLSCHVRVSEWIYSL